MKEKKEDIQSLYEFCETVNTRCEILKYDFNYYLSKYDEYKEVRAGLVEEGDREGIDQHDSVILENEKKQDILLALWDLTALVEKNPYPGERKHILSVAYSLLPDTIISGHHGKAAWWLAFQEIRVLTDRRIYFPAEGGIHTIESIEEQLYEHTDIHGYIPVAALANILEATHRTQVYRNTKESLIERGWTWGSKMNEGILRKTILPPDR